MGTEQVSVVTQLGPEEATKAMADGYHIVTGRYPSKKVLGLMVGQWALETGNGRSMRNYNFGNKKASGNDDYQYFRCSEIIDGEEFFFDPPAPECRFASYSSPAEGAAAYVQTLKKRSNWWNGLHSETVDGFIEGLTTPPAYFTANPTSYAVGLNNRMLNYKVFSDKYGKSGSVFASLITLALGFGLSFFGYRDYNSQKSYIKKGIRKARQEIEKRI